MSKTVNLIMIAAGVTAAAFLARKFIRKVGYNALRESWLDSFESKKTPNEVPLSDALLDSQRISVVSEIRSHYSDIARDYFRNVIYACNNVPDGTASIKTFIEVQFSDLETKLIAVNNACRAAIEAELSLLSDDYLTNLQSKPDYITSALTICDMMHENRIGYCKIISRLYKKRVDEWALSTSEEQELQDAINSFVNI